MENTRREGDGDATHVLMFTDAPAYDGARGQAAPAEPSHEASPANGRTHRNGHRPQLAGDDVPLIDEEIPI
jgi:hypothetical protein